MKTGIELDEEEEVILQCSVIYVEQQSNGVLLLTNQRILFIINGASTAKITIPFAKYSCFVMNEVGVNDYISDVRIRIVKKDQDPSVEGDAFSFTLPNYKKATVEDEGKKKEDRNKLVRKILLSERKCFSELLTIISKNFNNLPTTIPNLLTANNNTNINNNNNNINNSNNNNNDNNNNNNNTNINSKKIKRINNIEETNGVTKYPKILSKDDVQKSRQRASVLAKNPDLKFLHTEFVPSIISEENFWDIRKEIIPKENLIPEKQRTGLSSTMYSEIEPSSESGVNTLLYHLTPQVIKCFFVEFPDVKVLYDQKVPHSMSKEEFWKKFFLSPYYDENRMKKIGTITDRPDDIFKQQCKGIDLGIEPFMKIALIDPLIDLTKEELKKNRNLGEISSDKALEAIRKINRHSYLVLNQSINADNSLSNQSGKTNFELSKDEKIKKLNEFSVKIREQIPLEDLKEVSKEIFIPLQITDQRGYVQLASSDSKLFHSDVETENHLKLFTNSLENWTGDKIALTFSTEVTKPLNLIQDVNRISGKENDFEYILPKDFQKTMREKYLKAGEILRHFWGSYPIVNETVAEKVHLLEKNISQMYRKLEEEKKKFFEINTEENKHKRNLIQPILTSLNTAVIKYEEKKMQY